MSCEFPEPYTTKPKDAEQVDPLEKVHPPLADTPTLPSGERGGGAEPVTSHSGQLPHFTSPKHEVLAVKNLCLPSSNDITVQNTECIGPNRRDRLCPKKRPKSLVLENRHESTDSAVNTPSLPSPTMKYDGWALPRTPKDGVHCRDELSRAWNSRLLIREPTNDELDDYYKKLTKGMHEFDTISDVKRRRIRLGSWEISEERKEMYKGIRERDLRAGRLPTGEYMQHDENNLYYYADGSVHSPAGTHLVPLPATPVEFSDELSNCWINYWQREVQSRGQSPQVHSLRQDAESLQSIKECRAAHDQLCTHCKLSPTSSYRPILPHAHEANVGCPEDDRSPQLKFSLDGIECPAHRSTTCYHRPMPVSLENKISRIPSTWNFNAWYGIKNAPFMFLPLDPPPLPRYPPIVRMSLPQSSPQQAQSSENSSAEHKQIECESPRRSIHRTKEFNSPADARHPPHLSLPVPPKCNLEVDFSGSSHSSHDTEIPNTLRTSSNPMALTRILNTVDILVYPPPIYGASDSNELSNPTATSWINALVPSPVAPVLNTEPSRFASPFSIRELEPYNDDPLLDIREQSSSDSSPGAGPYSQDVTHADAAPRPTFAALYNVMVKGQRHGDHLKENNFSMSQKRYREQEDPEVEDVSHPMLKRARKSGKESLSPTPRSLNAEEQISFANNAESLWEQQREKRIRMKRREHPAFPSVQDYPGGKNHSLTIDFALHHRGGQTYPGHDVTIATRKRARDEEVPPKIEEEIPRKIRRLSKDLKDIK